MEILVENVDDVGVVAESFEVAEGGVDLPGAVCLLVLQLFELRVGFGVDLAFEVAEGLHLVGELIDHLPEPLVGQLEIKVTVENEAEEIGVVGPAGNTLRERGNQAAEHMAKVELRVEHAKDSVIVGDVSDRAD